MNGISPETEFIYDVELPAHFTPANNDGEVAGNAQCCHGHYAFFVFQATLVYLGVRVKINLGALAYFDPHDRAP